MGKEVRYKRSEEEEPTSANECQGRVSDAEVESVMKLLVTYQKARSEGIAPPNPELDVRPRSISGCEDFGYLVFLPTTFVFSPRWKVHLEGKMGWKLDLFFLLSFMVIGSAYLFVDFVIGYHVGLSNCVRY